MTEPDLVAVGALDTALNVAATLKNLVFASTSLSKSMKLQLVHYHSDQTILSFAPEVVRQVRCKNLHLLQVKYHLKDCQNARIGNLYATL